MPCMPRPSGKAKKIAFNILGEPANLQFKRTKKQRQENKELIAQETVRVK